MKGAHRLYAGVLLASATTACTNATTPPVPVATSIQLSVTTINLSAIGGTATITATVLDQNGTPMTDQPITWTASNPAVATVGSKWTTVTVVAVGNGTTKVTAASGAVSQDATVTVQQVGTDLVKISGDEQTGQVADSLPDPLVVELRDEHGNVVPGGTGGAAVNSTVRFAVTAGGGTVTSDATVGPDGRASSVWVLGGAAGDQVVTASTQTNGVSVTFTATGTPENGDSLVIVSGDGQQGTVGFRLADSINVRVVDRFGNGITGWTVEFVANDVGAAVTPALANTNLSGELAAVWTLGAAAGPQTLTVAAQGILKGSPATVNATAFAPTSTALVKVEGDGQVGLVGEAVNVPPAVEVMDQFGNGIPDVVVTFAVTGGNGSVTGATDTTDANGIGRVGSWVLDPAVGANAVEASSPGVTSVSYSATGQTAAYDIEVRYFGADPPTANQQAAFVGAANKWTSLVFGDLDTVSVVGLNLQDCLVPADTDLPSSFSEVIDDLVIYAKVDSIDGAGDGNVNILAQAGPCYVRTGGSTPGLPLIGIMVFDEYDLAGLEAAGLLGSVITHEMGHVLGFGSLWNLTLNGTVYFSLLTGAGTSDPYFTGTNGRAAFDRVGGATYLAGQKVPVENLGGTGTRDAHWRESVFDRELMTGFLDTGAAPQPISIVTLGSLWDMNYLVAYAHADAFAWPAPPMLAYPGTTAYVELVDDVYHGPVYGVDPAGRVVGVIRR